MKNERIAEIQLVDSGIQQMLRVTVPKGTTLAETIKLQPELSKILGKLKGCLPCNSGVPIFFQEREEIERVVRIDLATMQHVG
jgi:hypothetical protein